MYKRALALFLAFLLGFSLVSEPLQAYATMDAPGPSAQTESSEQPEDAGTSEDLQQGSELSPYEIGTDTLIFETTAEGGASFTVEIQSGSIPDDATLNANLLDPESDEYADAMLSAWISFNIDPEKDLFQMVPYDIYFTDLDGERIPYDGEATVTMTFDTDPFGDTDAQRFISLMDESMESTKIEIEEISSSMIRFQVPALSILSYTIMEKAQPVPGSMGSIDALLDLPKDEVGAAYEVPEIKMLGMVGGENWYFDIYYVDEDDYNYVEFTDNFNLKYQIEVHVDQNYDAGAIKITVPRGLLLNRSGNPILPSDIAVPRVEPGQIKETAVSQFNYYIDGDNMVFFNYCPIESGTNNAWQVLYKNVDVMEIIDLSTWDLVATGEVTDPTGTETQSAPSLSGLVDTNAVINSVTKVAYSNTGASYGPGLYTEKQVSRYVSLPAEYSGDNFDQYKYVLWQVSVSASATQPYDITMVETPGQGGVVIGGMKTGSVVSNCKRRSYSERYYVVTAYPKDSLKAGDEVNNFVQFTVHPIDNIDPDTTKSASASWRYADYEWHYSGDIIGIDKGGGGTYSGWLELYKELNNRGIAEEGVSIPFTTTSTSRSFKLTHYIDGENISKRIPGMVTRVTTVDDAVYAYPSSGPEFGAFLTGEDYYFDSVTITQKDVGYDVWEDETTDPEGLEPSETGIPGMEVYAMFADKGINGNTDGDWELVTTVPWNSSGVLSYSFSPAEIARKPYRVKAVHDTMNYSTTCTINVRLKIRQDSPVMKRFLDASPDMSNMQFENVSGVTGMLLYNQNPYVFAGYPAATYGQGGESGWYHDYTIHDTNYSEEGLIDFSVGLYNTLPMRDNAFANITPVSQKAGAAKTHIASNDIINGRLNVTYNLTAHDGWLVGSEEIGRKLAEYDILKSPGRNHIVFYDLLPYGMQFDPSSDVIAGRVTDISEKAQTSWINPKSWNTSDVTVIATVEDTNYNGTTRTLVKFDITYTGYDDPVSFSTTYNSGTREYEFNYFEGWGVSFQGYFDWDDIGYSDKSPNVCVCMPGPEDSTPFLGNPGQVFNDDGNPPAGGYEDDYRLFGANIDKSPTTQENCVLYAAEVVMDDTVLASQSSISKLVRADSNEFGTFEKSAVVDPSGTYTYEITVQNTSKPIKNIVVFDRLENASKDRIGPDGLPLPHEPNFDSRIWYGTFLGVVIDQLKKYDIQPVVYYNTNREAPIPNPDGTENPSNVLTISNGWYRSDQYTGRTEDIKAIAVDLSKTTSNADFVLNSGQSVSFRIQMQAPDKVQTNGAIWAYNNPSFYREMKDRTFTDQDQQLVIGNSVQVKYGDTKNLEIEKEFIGEYPPGVENDRFTMYLTETIGTDTHKFSDRVYTLWEKQSDVWVQIDKDKIMSTGADGTITLKTGQKAVFENIPGGDQIIVVEEESPFWKCTEQRSNTSDTYTIVMQNKFRPVLYAMKAIEKLPTTEKGKAAIANDEFKFQLKINDKPAANVLYWYVTSMRTDGGIPTRVTGKAEGHTDENGYFTLKYNDIVAIIGSGDSGDKYEVSEVGMTENWITRDTAKTGTLQLRGSSATITNIYKWRSFVFTKTIQHQDIADAEDVTFKFKIEKKNPDGTYTALDTGNHWVMTDSTGTKEEATSGNINPDGTFECKLAGKYIRIDDLEADETYRITELSVTRNGLEVFNTLYEPLKTSDEWKMPLHAFTSSGAYANEWRMRPLYVTKTVTFDEKSSTATQKANAAVFEIKVEVDLDTNNDGKPDGNLVPLKNFPFRVYKNGTEILAGDPDAPTSFQTDSEGRFKIKNGQVVAFKDAGLVGAEFRVTETNAGTDFHQVFPTGNQPVTGKLARDGTESSPTSIVNGMDSAIMLTKEYAIADDNAQAYYDAMKDLPTGENPLEVTITIRAFTNAGKSYVWPNHDTEVGIMREGESLPGQTVTWEKNKSFTILPGQIIVLKSGIDDDTVTNFNVSESSADRQWMQVWTKTEGDDYLIECTQTYPANGKAMTGQNGALKSITFVNTLTAHKPTGSMIMKDMVPGADPIPTYERLTFILEKKSGEDWIPAEGVQYYIGHYVHGETQADWRDFEENATKVTDKEGLIEVYKADYTFPFVQFLTDTVYIYGDPKTPETDGTLRIRESLADSDISWGTFAWNSLLETGEQYKPGWQATEGERTKPYDTIVNTNRTTKVRVGKQSSSAANTQFTFYLNQVIDVDWSKAKEGLNENNYKAAIKSSLPATNVQYYIWKQAASELETPTRISGPHTIGEDGKFVIEAGQYAEFALPDKTVWTVEEEATPGYYLDSMVTVEGKVYTTKLNENITLISSAAGVIGDRITAESTQLEWICGNEIDKSKLTVTLYDSENKSRILTADEYTLEPAIVPDVEGTFTVVVTDNKEGLTAILTFTAKKVAITKYAVRIYGILTDDINEPNMKAALTFGPATGGDYTNNHNSKNLCKQTGKACISNLTWEEIIAQAEKDPSVFKKCMEAGCVVSVPINITGPLAGKSYPMDDGDGASILYGSISSNYKKWNSEYDETGGWPASRIRATLNGQDTETNTAVAGTDCLTADQSLFSAFPQVLQDAIVAKAVTSDIVYNKFDTANQKTTYDKLWLFSGGEIYEYDSSGRRNSYLRVNNGSITEGPQYSANKALGVTSANYGNNKGYNEVGSTASWWVRSLGPSYRGIAGLVNNDGSPYASNTSTNYYGLAPGFCIGSLPAPVEESYTVKYAVRIYGIEVDDYLNSNGDKAAITFGPATSTESYVNNTKGRNLCGGTTCISKMTWSEIIAQARTNPHAFDDCMNAGCVVSVPLNITGPLAEGATSYEGQWDEGDGASVLYNSIASNYRKWNSQYNEKGGWPASRIRATLNGQDGRTDTTVAGADCLTTDQSLFSAFPQVLQDAIVAKTVKSDTVYNSFDIVNVETTYDKLWLFSSDEVFAYDAGASSSYNNRLRIENGVTNEGPQYPGNIAKNITTKNYRNNKGYNEAGSALYWWLRSLYRGSSGLACYVYSTGNSDFDIVIYTDNGLAPGFCIR